MKKLLGTILQWTLLGVLFLGIPSALADPINQVAGQAVLDQASPRVWRNQTGAAFEAAAPTAITTAVGEFAPITHSVVYACDGTCATLHAILMQQPTIDAALAANNALYTFSALQGFNGTTFDRLRAQQADALTLGVLNTGLMGLNAGGTLDRLRASQADTLTAGILNAGSMAFDGTSWNRARSASADALVGGGTAATTGIAAAGNMGFNGASWNRHYTASTTFHGLATTGSYIQPVIPWSQWNETNTPATATQATASRALGAAGVRHVATTITACLAAGATAQTPVVVNLRDGASGAGTVLRSWAISAPVNDSHCVDLSGIAMLGTAATAMTLEFAAAGVTASQQTVTLTGYSTVATTN